MSNKPDLFILSTHYANWIESLLADGADAFLLTFMFKPIPGNTKKRTCVMKDEIERTYAKQLTRHHRNPKRAELTELPIWIGCPDWPVLKHNKKMLSDVFVNDGVHFHMIAIVPHNTRMDGPLSDHIRENQSLYAGPNTPIDRLDAEQITRNTQRVVKYVTKSIENGRATQDDILILPRTHSEMR